MIPLKTPSQILSAEIDRLMADRRCDRREATAICRSLMATLANEADKEEKSAVANISKRPIRTT